MHQYGISFPLHAVHTFYVGEQAGKRFIVRLCGQLQGIFSLPLHFLSKLGNGSAGNQASIHENTYPVADLLDLVKLVGRQ